MLFILSKIASLLLRPSTLLLLCCLAGLLLGVRRRAARVLLWIGVGGFLAVMLLPLDQWALLPLEDRFPRPAPPAHVDGIIVLGGAIMPDMSEDRGIPSLNAAAERMTEGVALARRYPEARLVFTGGTAALIPGRMTEAGAAERLFTALGIPPARLTVEDVSRTTWENAVETRARIQPHPGETWLLVTSADHVARGVGAFRAVGWDVIGWPVGYKSGHGWRLWLPGPIGTRLAMLDEAVHEWIGLVVYRALGHSSALFPAP
jgi:uncharacterized SAM-binding protein YcdF (DUF218 family)